MFNYNTSNNPLVPSSISWNFPQPMQVQITTQLNSNANYQAIAKDFVEKYLTANLFGISNLSFYYNDNTCISIHIHQSSNHTLYEIVGHNNYKNKLAELSINTIRYYNLICTAQPVGKKSILITTNGKAEINNRHYNIMTTFIIQLGNDQFSKITNQILEIFL